MSAAEFRHVVEFTPGYNYLHEIGPQRRGQHGMGVRFVLIGAEGATQFVFNTMWTPLGEVDGESRRPCHVDTLGRYGLGLVSVPMGTDVGHHWRTPTYEGEYSRDSCDYLDGAKCYYDGSGLAADDLLRTFISEGVDPVWAELEAVYRRCQGDAS